MNSNLPGGRLTQRKKHRVKIYTTAQGEIQGEVSIPVRGYNARLSNFLNGSNTFISGTNAVIHSADDMMLANESFLSVNKQAIKLVIEEKLDSTKM